MLATNTSDSVRKSARESPRYGPNGTIARHDLERRCEAFRVAYAANWASSVENVNHGARAVDAVLCPASPGAAPPHGYARYWGYTAVWDLLEYPSMVFPVTAVDPDIDKIEQDFQPLSPQDLWNHRLCTIDPLPLIQDAC